MKRLLVAIVAVAALAGCEEAPAPRSLPEIMPNDRSIVGNHVLGSPTTPGSFEVIGRPGSSALHYWCSAGDYVVNKLHLLPNRRIYLTKPRGPSDLNPGGTSVTFTVLPGADILEAADALPEGDYSLSIARVGQNYLAAHGVSTCRSMTPIFWDLPGG